MSDLSFFDDPNLVPKPKDEVRIESIETQVYHDRYRIWVKIAVTPFRERPNLLLVTRDSHSKIVSELNIIETMHALMEFTLHLRGIEDPAGTYTLDADLFYENRNPPQDHKQITFTIPREDGEMLS